MRTAVFVVAIPVSGEFLELEPERARTMILAHLDTQAEEVLRGPRGGAYVATGPVERVIQSDPDPMTRAITFVGRVRARYVTPARALSLAEAKARELKRLAKTGKTSRVALRRARARVAELRGS